MLSENLREVRETASELGVPWRDVCVLKRDLVEQERLRREDIDGLRRRAWELYLVYIGRPVAGSIGFWRCGWSYVRARLENSCRDYTAIPRYDEIAASLRIEFPDWCERETEELYAWLFEDYRVWPARIHFYWEAIEQIEAQCDNDNEQTPQLEEAEF